MKQELGFQTLWQLILKYWKLLVLIPILSSLASALISILLITPLYESSTLLLVTVTRPLERVTVVHHDIRIARGLTDTYSEIIHSQSVLEEVISNLSLPYSAEQMRIHETLNFDDLFYSHQTKVKVAAVPDTELINISVTSPDPQLASNIANEVARVSIGKINEYMNIENIKVIEKARVPSNPFRPKITVNVVVAFFVGFMAALALTLLFDYFDRTIKDPSEVFELLELPVIGVIPKLESMQVKVNDKDSILTEAFHALRTNIQFSRMDKQNRQIVVTGANPKCGKSTVAINLAISIARSGASVLLVDADLHRPGLHHYFGIKNIPGLSTLIIEEDPIMKVSLRKSSMEGLMILPSGLAPPRPAKLLASDRMRNLVSFLDNNFDYIIYDTPPILTVTDAVVLSKLVDGVVFVIDHGRATRDEVIVAVDLMRKVKANIIGVVVNFIPFTKSQYLDYKRYSLDKQQ